jgi:ribose transport system permease protein
MLEAKAQKRTTGRSLRLLDFGTRYSLVAALGILIVVFSILVPETFPTVINLQTTLSSQSVLLVISLGAVIALASGEFDLSIGPILGFSLAMVGWGNVTHGWPIGLVIIGVLGVSVLVGITNAFFAVRVGISSIIVTLGTGTILSGIVIALANTTVSGLDPGFVGLIRHQIFGIQLAFYIAIALAILLWYMLEYTPLGRYLVFVGLGRDVAMLSGIRVDAIRAGSLIAAAVLSSIAGIILAGLLNSASAGAGESFVLPAYAAAFLGSTAIRPGRFNALGTVVAVYFLVTGITGLELLGLAGWIEQIFYGTALIAAVSLSVLATRMRRRLAAAE